MLLRLYCIRHHNALTLCTKYLRFLEVLIYYAISNLSQRYSEYMDTGFGSRKPGPPAYSPTSTKIVTKKLGSAHRCTEPKAKSPPSTRGLLPNSFLGRKTNKLN